MASGDPEDDGGSVTRWISQLKAGDAEAAQPLWERYFDRLVRLARQKLAAGRRLGGDEDEEDAALSAFESFCAGASRGRFPLLGDREDLWRLLVVITARKAGAQAQRRRAQKRGGDLRRLDTAGIGDDPEGLILEELAGPEPTPEFAAMVAEQYQLLLDCLGDDDLRRVAVWRLEGLTNDEIADRLGCARRTVARRLDLIRKIWSNEDDGEREAGP
ncbi:ECF-type sigma factor [Tautonia sociabilis]|uniref:RNA polymerase subunit sigma-70 n=1 Tax=Tautonia sociabilis TaxID=2080755 RepID=A0A432MJC4_9BACT|nr:ECF-type sigma factor [Tautonia sociabilis]RUL87246.1 RNA polymerase subunit sigma-70 [Tautonia sociabilis]